MKFSDLITTEDQYEVNKARASISFYTALEINHLSTLINHHFPSHSIRVTA